MGGAGGAARIGHVLTWHHGNHCCGSSRARGTGPDGSTGRGRQRLPAAAPGVGARPIAGREVNHRFAWHRLLPLLSWWPRVTGDSLRHDLIAALTGAVIVLPQAVAFASIAGLPPEYGLYDLEHRRFRIGRS